MNGGRLLCFLAFACITDAIRVKINSSHIGMNTSDRVADRASNSGCKCSSECGGEPQKWCRTEDKCGFPPGNALASALGYWDWCDWPRAQAYAIELTCKCVNKHSHSVMGMAGQMAFGGESIERRVTRELRGYWERLPQSKVGGIGGRGNEACHALCPKMCCSAWQRDQEKTEEKIPMYDGYDSCMFDVVGKIGSRWGYSSFLKDHHALTMYEEGYYRHKDHDVVSTQKDPEAMCMPPGCSVHMGDLSKAYIKGCPANPRAKTAWGEVAADVAMAVGDFLTPQWQGPRLGLNNVNPQVPNLGGLGGMGAMGAAAYFGA